MKAIGYSNLFGLLRYSLRKWWYRIVSTTFLRKIPFIREQRILYFKQTKEMLYLIEREINNVALKAKIDFHKPLKNRYLNQG